MNLIYGAFHVNSFSDLDALLKRHKGETITIKPFFPMYDYYESKDVKQIIFWCTVADVFIIDIYHTDNTNTQHISIVSTSDLFTTYLHLNAPFVLYFNVLTPDIYSVDLYEDLITSGFIIDENLLFLFRYNSSRNTVEKTLINVNVVSGQYTKPVTIKHFFVELKDIESLGSFNYIYIPNLKRYYYIKEITHQNDFAVLELIEDVLMSFASVIKLQTAYVERNENDYDLNKSDDYVTMDYDKAFYYSSIILTYDFYDMANNGDKYDFIVTTVG